jgi:diguanylate cyclase (GGDEF)-like protein
MGKAEHVWSALKWFEHAPGFIAYLTGPDLVFAHANDAFSRLIGRKNLIGLPLRSVLPKATLEEAMSRCQAAIASRETHIERAHESHLPGPGGDVQTRYLDYVLQPIPHSDGLQIAGLLIQGSDVTAETIAQRELQLSRTHDHLTGLPNYVTFRERLERSVLLAQRSGRPLQVAVIDIDLFKRVNALLGHQGGERALYELARRIERAAGPNGVVARESGARFLLMREGESSDTASVHLQAIASVLSEPFTYAGQTVYLTCCIGAASYPHGGKTANTLLLATDRALARAKEAGPGMLRWDDMPPDGAELQRFWLGFALREALAAGKLQVHYQPQVDLVTGSICAVEALVRWNRDGEAVPPSTIISVAEECGLIGELGDWILRTACVQVAQWHALGFNALRVAVNLSARQLAMHGLEASIVRALSDSGLPPDCLDLELTESLLMENIDRARYSLLALKQLGVRLCLDDFGTGYSSLAILRRLPIDVLKIDGSFLTDVPESETSAAMVNAIITMGHSLGMRVLAEKVERESQCDFLSRHMCDKIQGFYVSQAIPADAMLELLHAGAGLAPHLLRFNRTQPTLLLVDDEPSILSSLKRLLRNEGYRILTANSGSEGLDVLAQYPVDVIVSDQRMPGMTGVEFLRAVRQLYPDTVRIVLSGFTELQTVTDAVNAGAIYKFLTKPWDDEQLRTHIREALSYRAMANENRLLTLQIGTANQKLAAVNRQLEGVLDRQRDEIKRGEISLDIVHEALSKVPVPVLASDDLGTVVLANRAALALFAGHPVLGCDVRQLFPGLPDELPEGTGLAFEHCVGDICLPADLRPMGSGSHSRGWLIAVAAPHLAPRRVGEAAPQLPP